MISLESVLLAEYGSLKTEQQSRIGTRDNLLYAALVASGAIVAAAIGTANHYPVLLALPLVSVVLGWTHLANDRKIVAIGAYIQKDLAPRVQNHLPADSAAFGWETARRADPAWRRGRIGQVVVDVLTFGVSGATALAAYWILAPANPILIVVSIVELAALGVLSYEIAKWAFWSREQHP